MDWSRLVAFASFKSVPERERFQETEASGTGTDHDDSGVNCHFRFYG